MLRVGLDILLRTGTTPLSTVMRRLMTGYAVTFNIRHRRSGHLFQNRYKSVICEEDPYLLELIRYIHLNPLRAKLVEDLKALNKYPWTGHSVLLGKRKNPLISKIEKETKINPEISVNSACPVTSEDHLTGVKKEKSLAEVTIEDVLRHFGETFKIARRRYYQFVEKGIKHGRREDLQGSGLIRSSGGYKAALSGQRKEEREKGDARILGSGDFVLQALKRANELHERSTKSRISLNELIKRVSKDRNIDLKALISSKRKKDISNTRAIISYLAAIELRHSGAKIASELRLSEKSVSRCIERGKKLVDNDKKLLVLEYLQ